MTAAQAAASIAAQTAAAQAAYAANMAGGAAGGPVGGAGVFSLSQLQALGQTGDVATDWAASGDTFNGRLYDRDQGVGAARRAVDGVRTQ